MAGRGYEGDEREAKKSRKNLLDLRGEDKQVWLVKVPAAVYSAWEKAEESVEVGKLVAGKDAHGRDCLEVKLHAATTTVQGGRKTKVPTQFKLAAQGDVEDALTFSPTGGGGGSIKARVTRSYNLQPQQNRQYKGLMRERLVGATIKQNVVKPITKQEIAKQKKQMDEVKKQEGKERREKEKREGLVQDVYRATSGPGGQGGEDNAFNRAITANQAAAAAAAAAGLPTDGSGAKRERMDVDTLRSMLFNLFSRQDRYLYRDLNRVLNQPDQHLKDVLREVAVMARKGQFKNHWELKPEYKMGGTGAGDEEEEED